MKPISIVASLLLAATILTGCGRGTAEESTAERVKRVEERQKTDANFHIERKTGTGTTVAAPTTPANPPAAGTIASSQDSATAKVR